MKPTDGGQTQCPCCKKCTDCATGFQKVVDLKNAGLVVYRHTTQTEDVNELTGETELATKTTEDVYILHNTKDVDITTAHYLPEIKQNTVNCLRCRRIVDHAQKLLQKVPAINKNDVRGICEHCRTKEAPCFECKNVAKKFVACKAERARNTEERVKQWLSKIKYLLKDAAVDEIEVIRKGNRAHSELHIDQLCPETPKQREPDVNQMFNSGADGPDFAGIFPPSIEKRKKMFAHFQQLEKVDRPVVFIDAPKKAREPSTSYLYRRIRSKDVFSDESEELVDVISGRAKSKKETYVEIRDAPPVPCHSEVEPTVVTKQAIKGEKAIPSNKMSQERETLKFDQIFKPLDMDTKHFVKHGKAILIRRELSQKHETDPDTETLPFKPDQRAMHRKTIENKLIRKYHSEEMLLTTDSGVTGRALKQGFSYVFPQTVPDKSKLQRQKSSSELIKDTQDKLQKTDIDVNGKERIKKDKTPIKEKPTPTASTTSSKNIKRNEDKAKKDVDKPKKDSDTAKKEADKAKQEADKAKREADKAKKDEEKAKKDQMLKEKGDRLKKEKEEKERLKKEKKDQQQNEKADSLKKEKEEKERLKKEKQEQQNEKADRIKKEKDEKERLKQEKEEQKRRDNELKQLQKDKQRDKEDSALPRKQQAEKDKRADIEKSRVMLQQLQTKEEVKPEAPIPPKPVATTNTKDLNVKLIENRSSPELEILKLIRARKATGGERPKKLSDMNLKVEDVIKHKDIHKHNKDCTCMMCCDSTIELDAESLLNEIQKDMKEEIIIGQKIFTYKGPHHKQNEEDRGDFVPLFFQSKFDDTAPAEEKNVPLDETKKGKLPPVITSSPRGVIRYSLSNRSFIEKGWTMLPTEKVVRKMNMYRMRPAQPEFDWFEHNKHKRRMDYDTGEKLAEFDDIGRGRWFYRNGRMALDYYDAEETNANQRFVIYSNGEPDERGRSRPYTLLATFDFLGNGAVFDHCGKIRMKYNQTEGVVLDRSIGPVSHWQWHTLNDPPVLQKVMIDTQMEHKDPKIMILGPEGKKTRPDNEDMLAIEFQNFVKEKSKKLSQSFKPFQIKMKALRINEHFSLKVLDQATVYLIFRDGKTNLKLNIGMVLDHKEIVDTDSAEVGQVMSNVERLPARTNSLAELQKNIENAQQIAKMRIMHEQRLRPTMPCASADQLIAAASKPLRAHLATAHSGSTTTAADCLYRCSRKPAETNLYCVNRLC